MNDMRTRAERLLVAPVRRADLALRFEETRAVMEDIDALAEHLVASDRWSEERARQLVEDLLACGPVTAVG